ncbi:hypothetical protein KP79_PYT15670 [Mizuhopecten yessoensis]|uniref:Uncharacterized protein n=1 Tax=Mizuhopecten yessoensis TaxID=6573 RepID=A0A210PEF6_MIZYE|nr:hypothetical protein KP79_PYT15670 [Mizuhopecten yessoensis]
MGCNNSKVEEGVQQERKQIKVVPVNRPVTHKPGPSLNTGIHNTARKTELTALMQLKEEGVVPKKGEGGVAFVLKIDNMSESDESFAVLPGVPECRRNNPQYATYSPQACHGPPRRLPPINRSKSIAAIDAKLERARLNRERKIAERKATWARKYARVEASMLPKSTNVPEC